MRGFKFVYPVLLAAPLVTIQMRFMMGRLTLSAAPAWLTGAVVVLSIADIVLAFVYEGKIFWDPTAARLKAKGRDSNLVAAMVGTVAMLAPVCWALFASLAGLSVGLFVCFAVISFVGVAFWGWRYRRVIYPV